MGRALQQEYNSFAVLSEKFKSWPQFNDKKKSPKNRELSATRQPSARRRA
jgi:hypothetical protein